MNKKLTRLLVVTASILMLCFSVLKVIAQEKIIINGTVTDDSNGEPLPGATIRIKGANTGTVTDVNGAYSLSATTDAVLVLSFVGF